MWRYFGFSALITLAAIVIIGGSLGLTATLTMVVLIAIEIAFSFDNAIVNAKVLERLPSLWRNLFQTVGVMVAIVGMRILFPLVIVMVSAHLPLRQVINEALHHPNAYSHHVLAAQDSISAFGGGFLLTLAFYFLFDDNRKVLWLKRLERRLQKIGGPLWLPPALVALLVILTGVFSPDRSQIIRLGLIGVVSYTFLNVLIVRLGNMTLGNTKQYVGWSAFVAFLYLELLDAAFSFDSVLGAFAITNKVILIAVGLGVGAVWVRSLTLFMVKNGTLSAYKYLEHGAHYAILVLAIALLAGIYIDVPNAVTGIVGLGVIVSSFLASRQALR